MVIRKFTMSILRHYAVKSHNVQYQIKLAAFHGLVDLFGVVGTIRILMKAGKQNAGKTVRRKPATNQPVS